MNETYRRIRPPVAIFLAILFAQALTASTNPIGSVAGSMNAWMGNQALLPSAAIFSGDRLKVKDGAAIVVLSHGSRLAFGRQTQAQLVRDTRGVAVMLDAGDVLLYQPKEAKEMRVEAESLTVTPVTGYRAIGEVAILSGLLVITSKQGTFDVEGHGQRVIVAEGKTVTLSPKIAGAPQGGPATSAGSAPAVQSSHLLEYATIGASGVGIIVGALALSRADNSSTKADSALSAAQAAAAAGAAADSAAVAANSTAAIAVSAADAAALAASEAITLSEISTNALGCDLNTLANEEGFPSPYTPLPGFSCAH